MFTHEVLWAFLVLFWFFQIAMSFLIQFYMLNKWILNSKLVLIKNSLKYCRQGYSLQTGSLFQSTFWCSELFFLALKKSKNIGLDHKQLTGVTSRP